MKYVINGIGIIAAIAFIAYFVLRNNKREESLTKNLKYSIAKIESIEMGGKNWSDCSFYLHGNLISSYTRIIRDGEREQFLGKRFLVKYDSLNIKNAKILIDIPVPDNIKSPPPGDWKELPSWAIK
ncbi:hypothetical protein CJF12_10285 [Chryseobacterium piperi]|uniref:hypothetical protein n=1 Tax=Chryseobacterium piperi TaxID=558152 RepID=UPI00054E0A49|nr:hypothetical protein [Chryseobacterium piperi]ASW74632.1 hypothetical protein CJF12_10285 [Chryseobacterium piperi]